MFIFSGTRIARTSDIRHMSCFFITEMTCGARRTFIFLCFVQNTKTRRMEESTAPSDDQDQCMVCLNACVAASEHVWTCGCCHKRCHLLCIFQWTLRISLNRSSRTVTTFSCPGCRTDHAISGLPGFTQQRAGARTNTNVPRGHRRVADGEEDEEEGEDLDDTEEDDEDEGEDDDDTYEDDDANDDDEDDFLDEDEDEDDFGDRCSTSVSTKDIYIEIGQLTINITR